MSGQFRRDMAYTEWAVPVTTAGMGLFLLAGGIFLAEILMVTTSLVATVALGILLLGIICLLFGASIIGQQTAKKQRRIQESD